MKNQLWIVHQPFSIDEIVSSEFALEIIDLQCNNNLNNLYRSEEICSFYKLSDSLRTRSSDEHLKVILRISITKFTRDIQKIITDS